MDKERALDLAQGHVDLFFTGEDMLIEIWDGDDREAMVVAFQSLGFEVLPEKAGPSFTVRSSS